MQENEDLMDFNDDEEDLEEAAKRAMEAPEGWGEKSQRLLEYKTALDSEIWEYISSHPQKPADLEVVVASDLYPEEPEEAGLMQFVLRSNNSGALENFAKDVVGSYLVSKGVSFKEDDLQSIPALGAPDLSFLPQPTDPQEIEELKAYREKSASERKDHEIRIFGKVELPSDYGKNQ